MGHFVHTFAQQVSNINQEELGRTAIDWIQVQWNIFNNRTVGVISRDLPFKCVYIIYILYIQTFI